MSTELKAVNAVLKNNDMQAVLGEPLEIFSAYRDVVEYSIDYYNSYKVAPSLELVQEKFPDIDAVDVNGEADHYVKQVKDEFLTGQLQNDLIKAAKLMETSSASEVLTRLSQRVNVLAKYQNNPRDLNLKDIDVIQEYLDEVKATTLENDGVAGISTGLPPWDSAYTTGLAGGHFIVLFGYSGKMKSMLAAHLAIRAHDLGKKVLYINLEMSPMETAERLIAMKAKGLFSMTDWSRGDINPDDLKEFARKSLVNSPNLIIANTQGVPEVTPNWIQAKIEQVKPDLVICDYLQLMSDNARSVQLTPRMMNLSGELKQMSISNNIPMIAIAAVGDEENDKRDSPPQIKQISWSKSIEYNANLAVAVHLHNDTSLVEIAARKNRRGPLFNFFMSAAEIDRGIFKMVEDM